MAIIDNTIAAQIPQYDAATPLMQAAQIQKAQADAQEQQFKFKQNAVGAEMRGIVPFVNTPEFPARWAQSADKMLQSGIIDQQVHKQIRNSPSPLMLKSIIAKTEDPALSFRKEEAGREQKNQDRTFGLQSRIQARLERDANDPTPDGFEKTADGTYRPLPGGPQDPSYLARVSQAEAGKKNLPSGFEAAADGALRPIKGGPADPEYLRTKGDKQNAPSGYTWNDPSDPTKGMTAIPGGPGEKVDAEVAGRLGLAKSFLGQLPRIKERIEVGEATGLIDGAMGKAGIGGQGELRRQIDSGAEALLRMLTGAGMNKEEAAEYTRRYKMHPLDSAKTLTSKMNQLEQELNSVGETVGKGRGGWTPPGNTKAAKPPAADRFSQVMKENGGDKTRAYKKMQEEGY